MKVFWDFARLHPWRSVVTIACMLVAGVAEGVALASLLPLIALMTGQGGELAGQNGGVGRTISAAMESVGLERSLGTVLIVMATFFALKNGLLLLARRQNGFTVASVLRELRLRLVRALLQARWGYFVTNPIGTFTNAYASEADRSARAYLAAASCVSMAIQLVVYAAIGITTSWQLSLGSALAGGSVLMTLQGLVRMARRGGVRQSNQMRIVLSSLTDLLQGMKPLKAMAREDLAIPWIEEPTRRLERAWRKQVTAKEALAALQEPMFIGLLCLGIYLLIELFQFQLGEVVLLAAVLGSAFNATSKLQRRYQEVVVDESAYEMLLARIREAEGARERLHAGSDPSLRRGIELRHVAFDHGRTPLFADLSLEIRAGEITALVGPSGAGKTSVADLVAGISEPRSGEILIDGTPLSAIDLTRWRQRIGYVPQEPFLLHETIALNVSLGDPEITRADVERALRAAHAWEFVEPMPEGMDTVAGERGSSLSGGQRQRISIARAIVHRPWLLVLDEATTALDPESESSVWQAMKELRGSTTILAISHQPVLMEVADRVYRIESGAAQLLTGD